MAWGYWSATTVSDKARSPRRSTAPTHSHIPPSIPTTPAPSQIPCPTHQSESPEDEDYQPPPLSRRPSLADIEFTGPLDIRDQREHESMSIPMPMCSHIRSMGMMREYPPDLPLPHDFSPGYSRNMLGDLSPPKSCRLAMSDSSCFYYQTAAMVHHQQCLVHDVGGSEDEDLEPGYATVFPNRSVSPTLTFHGEDSSIARRGARRWRKYYLFNGHIFQPKRFNKGALCAYCQDRIWGLGRQGFKCLECKLMVHKKCHKLIKEPCTHEEVEPTENPEHSNAESPVDLEIQTPTLPHIPEFPDSPTDTIPDPIVTDTLSNQADDESTNSCPQRHFIYSLDDFNLLRVIGRGSFAKVLMVELKKTREIYAMKVIHKALVMDEEDIDWVQTEKHVFETATNHPFLVGLHSCFQTPSRLFFVIEFVRGGDLMFHMQRQGRLPEKHARFYAAEISLALNFLHSKGIIYRDLKLDNVLLDHEGHIKLTDYGICKEGIGPGDTTSTFCGTPNYIAPEIIRGEEYSFSVDWWALGVLLYEMLAGRSPFDLSGASDNPDQNTEDYLFQVILEKNVRIPRSLSVKAASVLKGFLQKNPSDRLGCLPETGFADIENHSFFRNIDWMMLYDKQIPTPYQPKLESEMDLSNFDPFFTTEPVKLTPDIPCVIEKIDQTEFEGFEYSNPLMDTETCQPQYQWSCDHFSDDLFEIPSPEFPDERPSSRNLLQQMFCLPLR